MAIILALNRTPSATSDVGLPWCSWERAKARSTTGTGWIPAAENVIQLIPVPFGQTDMETTISPHA
jgi:hypothetical protein